MTTRPAKDLVEGDKIDLEPLWTPDYDYALNANAEYTARLRASKGTRRTTGPSSSTSRSHRTLSRQPTICSPCLPDASHDLLERLR